MRTLLTAVLLLSVPSACIAEEFVAIPISELNYPAGAPPTASFDARWNGRGWQAPDIALYPSVQLDGDGEAYLLCPQDSNWRSQPSLDCPGGTLSLRLPAVAEVVGTLVAVDGATGRATRTKFTLAKETVKTAWERGRVKVKAAPSPTPVSPGVNRQTEPPLAPREAFFRAKENRYSALLQGNAAGAAWFRHQVDVARKERGAGVAAADSSFGGRSERMSKLEDTFDLFSGGRAVSENLQLDRGLMLSESGEEKIDVATVPGITVAEIDWAPLNKDAKPDVDPLARMVPSDQYALFFPSITAMIALMDEAQRTGGELLSILDLRAEDAGVRERYQQQLCLPLSEFTRIVGPALVNTVAITGSDPYFRTGTDLAILLESAQKEAIVAYISARYAAVKAAAADVQPVSGSFEGVGYSGVVTPDRRISSYLAVLDSTVVVSNSRVQLERVIGATKGKLPQLVGLGEYAFFRNRYRRDAGDSGLLIVPDAAIRKWGGPTWRIGDSRRSRAASMLSELQANQFAKIVRGELKSNELDRSHIKSAAALGELSVDSQGVRSAKYGTLAFLTPIAELSIGKISSEEQSAYGRFRDTYSAYWRGYFDPIGLRFSLSPGERAMDLTVMPLIVGTDYRELMQIAQGIKLDEFSGDLHPEALITFTAAIDSSAQWTQFANRQSQMFLPGLQNPLSWIGKSFTIFVDQSPLFEEAQKAPEKDRFLESHYQELPIGLFVEVQDTLKLTAVLTAIRSFVEQSAPGMTVWENLVYEGVPYVKIGEAISAVAAARQTARKPWGLYYVATPEALVLSLREDLLKRAIGRLKDRNAESAKALRKFAVGSQAALVASKDLLRVIEGVGGEDYGKLVRTRCWSNLPILNEWKALFPDRDPVELHQQLWKTRLHCPAGGEYVWNEGARTMESTVFGHPGAPKELPKTIPTLNGVESAALALGFENNGLRARAVLRDGLEKKGQ